MPTECATIIVNGCTFDTFALSVAKRSQGAMLKIRDEPLDAAVPAKFEPSEFHKNALTECEQRLEYLSSLTAEQADAEALSVYWEAVQKKTERVQVVSGLRTKYFAMMAKVAHWVPPTPAHENLRARMFQEIEISLKSDCDGEIPEPVMKTGKEWLSSEIEYYSKDAINHRDRYAEEVRKTNENNAWLAALRSSLPMAEPTQDEKEES